MPATAIEALADALHEGYVGCTGGCRNRCVVDESAAAVLAERCLAALAADPDLIERLADAFGGAFPFHPKPEAYQREVAERALAALFGVASPSTKETMPDA